MPTLHDVPTATHLDILFSDENYVAINKPAGSPSIPGRDAEPSALEILAHQLNLPHSGPADPRLRIIHRIDRDTSGLLLFAKHRAAQRHASEQFRARTVAKEYLALVTGNPAEDSGVIEAPIAPHPSSAKRMTIARQGHPSITHWQVERRFRAFTLLRVFPKTGKTHQIRVHLRSIGHPLAIDPLYNPTGPRTLLLSSFKRHYRAKPGQEERPLIDRLTLHARRLHLKNLDGQDLALSAEIPKDLRATLNMLAKYSS